MFGSRWAGGAELRWAVGFQEALILVIHFVCLQTGAPVPVGTHCSICRLTPASIYPFVANVKCHIVSHRPNSATNAMDSRRRGSQDSQDVEAIETGAVRASTGRSIPSCRRVRARGGVVEGTRRAAARGRKRRGLNVRWRPAPGTHPAHCAPMHCWCHPCRCARSLLCLQVKTVHHHHHASKYYHTPCPFSSSSASTVQ